MNLWLNNGLPFNFFLALCLTSIGYFLSAYRWKFQVVCIGTFIFLLLVSPLTCIWLSVTTLLVGWELKRQYNKKDKTNLIIVLLILGISLIFLLNQYRVRNFDPTLVSHSILFLGIAYYTCRHIHALIEAHKGRLGYVTVMAYIQYSFFLPVMVNGPIHRYQHFARQLQRRSFCWEDVFSGLERILYGYVRIILLGNYFFNLKVSLWLHFHLDSSFFSQFIYSANDWIVLYFVFAGYTDVALGFAKMWGVKIEENFNSPFIANNLIEFWQRWHITLSQWCKDYIYLPVLAYYRRPVLGVMLAMIAIGIWHQFSLYYLVWGAYQALGIVLCRAYQRHDYLNLNQLPNILKKILTRLATFSWLFSAKPIIFIMLQSMR